MQSLTPDILHNLKEVIDRIHEISRVHDRSPPRLLAVSKRHSPLAIQAAYDAGQRAFGENFVNELEEKAGQLPGDIEWHLIGHLQTNKVRNIVRVRNLAVVETVDSKRLAEKLQNACEQENRKLKIFVQVNVSGESSKHGCTPEEAAVIAEFVKSHCPNLTFRGFMTIGDPANPVVGFATLRGLISRPEGGEGEGAGTGLELSMGMSADLEAAIEWGSSEVRIGTAIFGPRSKT